MKRRMVDRGDGALVDEIPFVGLTSSIADTTAGASATPLPSGACKSGVLLQASPNNAAIVRWGHSEVDATHGGWLSPGAAVFVRCSDSGQVYVACATSSQVVAGVRL